MGKPGAFLTQERVGRLRRPCEESVQDFEAIAVSLTQEEQRVQASRCMDCGVPFCQAGLSFGGTRAVGCPLHNLIPEVQDLVWQGRWEDAAERLSLTNPFPEFTGRVCPAMCEKACNLGEHDAPVSIREDMLAVDEHAWSAGLRKPLPRAAETAPLVGIVGSGPAGLALAWELTRLGLRVRVVERADRAGGLLTYGIPAMKLPKDIVERRIRLMRESGVEFVLSSDCADPTVASKLLDDCDVVALACGATHARTVGVPGEDAQGVYPAVAYLTEATRSVLDGHDPVMSAQGKDVLVIGGGDTGCDCVATALRQGAHSVHQVIRAAQAPAHRSESNAWPEWPRIDVMEYGHEEAQAMQGEDPRLFATDTLEFLVENGAVRAARLKARQDAGAHVGEPYELPAQLVLVAKGFTGVEAPLMDAFSVSVDEARGIPVAVGGTHRAESALPKPVFVAGDAHMGSSLVANAMADAIVCAGEIANILL